MKIAVYPGSFDPITNGHMDIILRVSKLVDKLYIGVLNNQLKKQSFTSGERVALIERSLPENIENITVVSFSGLLIDFAKEVNAGLIIRGLRAVTDFEYEFQMALTNRSLLPEVETLLIPTSTDFLFLSSSIVKEIATFGGNIDGMIPAAIKETVEKRLRGMS